MPKFFRSGLRVVASFLFASLLFVQLAYTVKMAHQVSDDVSVTFARDNDGGVMIQTLIRQSHWTARNGWYAYGPVYYRVSHLIAKLDAALGSGIPSETTPSKHEEIAHFALLLASILALFGISCLLGWCAGSGFLSRVTAALLINTLLLSHPVWVTWVFRPHPDILLTFLITLGCLVSFLGWSESSKGARTLLAAIAAVTFGVAIATKISGVYFFAAALVFFALPLSWSAVTIACLFVLLAVLGYFLIGFPQSLDISETFEFLRVYSRDGGGPPTVASTLAWFRSFFAQSYSVSLLILVLAPMFSRSQDSSRPQMANGSKNHWFICAFFVLSFGLLIRKEMFLPTQHYTLPYAAVFWLSEIFLLKHYIENTAPNGKFHSKWREYTKRRWQLIGAFKALVMVAVFWSVFSGGDFLTTRAMSQNLVQKMTCHEETMTVKRKFSELIASGKRILADPYVPSPRDPVSPGVVHNIWGVKFSILGDHDAIFTQKQRFYSRYQGSDDPGNYVRDDKEWEEKRVFYNFINGKSEFLDNEKKRWKLVLRDTLRF